MSSQMIKQRRGCRVWSGDPSREEERGGMVYVYTWVCVCGVGRQGDEAEGLRSVRMTWSLLAVRMGEAIFSRGWEWTSTDSQQGKGSFSWTTTWNWIPPTTWMTLEADSSQIRAWPANTLILLWDPEQRNQLRGMQISDWQTCQTISRCCFKPLHFW